MADEPNVESLQQQLAAARAHIKELNDESAGRRQNEKKAREELEAVLVKHADEVKGYGEKLTAAEKAAKDAADRASAAVRDAALRVAAKDAGIVDMDGLKLLDTSAVTVGEDGAVSIPAKFFEQAKEAKPYLFNQTGSDTGTTASTAKTPPRTQDGPKHALKMNDAEYAAARAAALRG